MIDFGWWYSIEKGFKLCYNVGHLRQKRLFLEKAKKNVNKIIDL